VHCPHVGPSGGGKCVNIDYVDAYFNDLKLFGTSTPHLCPQHRKKEEKEGKEGKGC
jgi:hypothetical protein